MRQRNASTRGRVRFSVGRLPIHLEPNPKTCTCPPSLNARTLHARRHASTMRRCDLPNCQRAKCAIQTTTKVNSEVSLAACLPVLSVALLDVDPVATTVSICVGPRNTMSVSHRWGQYTHCLSNVNPPFCANLFDKRSAASPLFENVSLWRDRQLAHVTNSARTETEQKANTRMPRQARQTHRCDADKVNAQGDMPNQVNTRVPCPTLAWACGWI